MRPSAVRCHDQRRNDFAVAPDGVPARPFARVLVFAHVFLIPSALLIIGAVSAKVAWGAGGTLTVEAYEESSKQPTIARMEFWRPGDSGKPLPVRRTVSAGYGVVLDRSVDLTVAEGPYAFRMIRGPEYRVVSGQFTIEKTSLDRHTVELPRMVDMLALGWTSGDCFVPPVDQNLSMRMAAEDLHLATVPGSYQPHPIPGRSAGDLLSGDEPLQPEPSWIVEGSHHEAGLVFYGPQPSDPPLADSGIPSQRLAAAAASGDQVRVAVENPFAWALPVWLASERIEGMFVLGDWLRLDRRVTRIPDGRGPESPMGTAEKAFGYWAERIYWNLLEAGFRIAPLAGSGSDGKGIPVGYNRLYVGRPLEAYEPALASGKAEAGRVASPEEWWELAWRGCSIATNGPLLRPTVGGRLPGHTFEARSGETLELEIALTLTVRDPVEYLEVIHNGRVHYSARLDEFAKAGGRIPKLVATESGWVLVRVVTEYPDHFRAAISAPWYLEFDGRRRVSRESVDFFRRWLTEHESRLRRLPPERLAPHVPFVQAARTFWSRRADESTTP